MAKDAFPTKRGSRKSSGADDDGEMFGSGGSAGRQFGGYEPPQEYESSDPLWTVYNIMPELPFGIKVEKLLVTDMSLSDIAEILKEPVERVKSTAEDIKTRWLSLGASLSAEERKMARGRMIADYQTLIREIEQLNARTPDYKHINLKHQLLEKIAKLQGVDKLEAARNTDAATDVVEDAIGSLSPDATRELLRRLTDAPVRVTAPSTPTVEPEQPAPVTSEPQGTGQVMSKPKYPTLRLED